MEENVGEESDQVLRDQGLREWLAARSLDRGGGLVLLLGISFDHDDF